MPSGDVELMHRIWMLILLLTAGIACSNRGVETHPVTQLPPLPDDAPIYLFVRAEELPECPWETIGSVRAEPGWLDRQDERDAVSAAVRRMGGQAVLLESRDDVEPRVIRFLSPYSFCDPRK
jgi:hypothetical protein